MADEGRSPTRYFLFRNFSHGFHVRSPREQEKKAVDRRRYVSGWGGGGLQRRYISARGDWPEMVNSCYPFPPRRFRRPAFLPSAASLTRYGLPAWTSMVRPRRQAATKSPRNGGPHAGHFVLHQGHWINENGRLAEREGRPLMGGPPIHSVKVRWGVQVSATSAGASKGLHGRGGDIGTARSAGCFRGGPGVQLPRE